jgi:hypothetical protein
VADVARCDNAIFPFISLFLKPKPVAAVFCTLLSSKVMPPVPLIDTVILETPV